MPGLEDKLDDILEPVVKVLKTSLTTTIQNHLIHAFIRGDLELVTWGKTLGGIPITYEGPPMEQAIKWAKDHCAQLVTKMDDETKTRLAQVVSDAIQNKRGIPGLARDLRNTFDDMSKYRSQLIAKTETRNALWKGSHERMVAMEIDGKEWVLGSGGNEGNCDECIANAGAGIIPVNEEFPNPEGSIHPGCTCAIAPARLGKGKDDEEWDKSLSPEEMNIVRDYQGNGFNRMRGAQAKAVAGKDLDDAMKFEKILDKAPKYNGTTYRGLSQLSDDAYVRIGSSKEMQWKAIASSSSDRAVSEAFLDLEEKGHSVLFKIKSKTGADIRSLARQGNTEMEIVLRRNTKYKVTGSEFSRTPKGNYLQMSLEEI